MVDDIVVTVLNININHKIPITIIEVIQCVTNVIYIMPRTGALHGFGHFAVCCETNIQEVRDSEHRHGLFLGSVTVVKVDESTRKVDLKVFGKTVNFKIDSGADT